MATVFYTPINNARSTLTSAHTAGDGQLVLANGSSFGTPSASAPIRVSAATGGSIVIFKATGKTSNTLTGVVAIEGTTDINVPLGEVISGNVTAGFISDLNTAVNTLETTSVPGGSNTQVQYNTSGNLGGDAGLLYDATNDKLQVGVTGTAVGMIGVRGVPTFPVDVRGDSDTSSVGPVLVKSVGATSIFGTAVTLDTTSVTGGKKFSVVSTGDAAFGGAGDCAIYCGSSSSYVYRVDSNGQVQCGKHIHAVGYLGQFTVVPNALTTKGVVVRGATSQTAPLEEWQRSDGVVLSSVDASGFAFPRAFTFGLGQAVSVATGADLTNWLTCPRNGKFVKWAMNAKTAPTGADLMIDILKSSDNGTSFTSLWATNTINRPRLVAGNKTGSGTLFDTTAITEGDLLRIDVVQVGSVVAGQSVTVSLLSLLRNQ